MDRVAIGLDIGGTKLAGAIVAADGTVLHELIHPCPRTAAGRDPGLAGTMALTTALVTAAEGLGVRIDAVGAGFPEYVDRSGRLRSHEVLAWERQPAQLLADAVPDATVVVDADVRCGAVAEARLGAGRDQPSALYVSVGTGLSSTLVLGGVPLRGARGEAIALGELDSPDGVGRLEPRTSGAGIGAAYTAATGVHTDGATAVQALALEGDEAAETLLRDAGAALGSAIGAVVALLDPGVVVLGGGLGTATGTTYAAALDAAFAARTAERPGAPALVRAALGPSSGVLGAALRALD